MNDAEDKPTIQQQQVVNLLDSHSYAMRGIRGSKWAMLAASTAMAGGVLASVVPEADEVIPKQVPIGGAVVATLAGMNRRGNRWLANDHTNELKILGIAPPKDPAGAFVNIHNGTLYVPPPHKKANWTVICADKKALSTSPSR